MKDNLRVKIILSKNFDSKEIILVVSRMIVDGGIYHFWNSQSSTATFSVKADDAIVFTQEL